MSIATSPLQQLAIQCVEDYFGPASAQVARAVAALGEASSKQLQGKCRGLDASTCAQALVVLLQHSVVTTEMSPKAYKVVYRFQPARARALPRHAVFLDLVQRHFANKATVSLVEALIKYGRMTLVEWLQQVEDEDGALEAAAALVEQGYVQPCPTLDDLRQQMAQENEFGNPVLASSKAKPSRRKDHMALQARLNQHPEWQEHLPSPAHVFDLHHVTFYDHLRALVVGKLVGELVGPSVASGNAAALVTAALRYAKNHKAPTFRPQDTVPLLPPTIAEQYQHNTSMHSILTAHWQQVARMQHPIPLCRSLPDNTFVLELSMIMEYWCDRVCHQIVAERLGVAAARILRLLLTKGYMEAEHMAQYALVPVKETREMLNALYRAGYVHLFPLRANHPSSAIYLWGADQKQLRRTIRSHVAKAALNLRLRRQSHNRVSKNFYERAQHAAPSNPHPAEDEAALLFNLGLERLDYGLHQLDETLMVLFEFQNIHV